MMKEASPIEGCKAGGEIRQDERVGRGGMVGMEGGGGPLLQLESKTYARARDVR